MGTNVLVDLKDVMFDPSELFTYNDRTYNVFEWIEKEHYWMVEQRTWEVGENGIINSLVITDHGYMMAS
ncbi:hypothetical protein [Aquimarina pacifica]|uniref:hypothetical protein n=1 Tax=Aquimarina pacifica TaxID=1296415 RepID=UPI0004B36F21|nr:hypothetical protein [Aquimarina pacifica]